LSSIMVIKSQAFGGRRRMRPLVITRLRTAAT
jgi:hypothetical protein